MRHGLILATMFLAATLSPARLVAQSAALTTVPTAQRTTAPSAKNSKHALKQAEKHYQRGLKHQKNHQLQAAFDDFSEAVRLAPESVMYVTACEQARQTLVQQLLNAGNREMQSSQAGKALAYFKQALQLDPSNTFARQRIYDALPPLPKLDIVRASAPLTELNVPDVRKRVVLRGNSQMALEQMARTFGITAFIDPSVPVRQLNLTLDNVTWQEASDIVCRASKTFWMPIAPNQVIFASDDDSTRRALQRMGLETFYISPASPQELNDITNALRVMFDIRFLTANATQGTITVRAPQPIMDVVAQFLQQLQDPRPQVMLDVKVYTVSSNLAREVGTTIPNSFTIFNVPTEAQKLLGGQSIQDIIAQLQNSGNISQALSGGLAGLIAQALSGSGNSPLTSPFVTFGGGITLTGITVPALTEKLHANESSLHSLQQVVVRASQGNPATVKVGQRYPIVTATYSGALTSSLSSALNLNANSQFNAIPAIQYEDLGLDLKATPRVSRSGLVMVDLEMQIRALEPQNVNGMPIITNREFKNSFSTRDGEPIVIAGLISKSETHSLGGIPFLSQVPLLGDPFTSYGNNKNDDEVLVVMTPHIVSAPRSGSQLIPLPAFIQR